MTTVPAIRIGSPKFITGLSLHTEIPETEIRTWLFNQLPLKMHEYNQPGIHFAYLLDLFDRDMIEPFIGEGLKDLAGATTDTNYVNHIRIFEYALDHGLGRIAYTEAHILTYRLGIITIHKADPETQLRVLQFLDKLDAHSSD